MITLNSLKSEGKTWKNEKKVKKEVENELKKAVMESILIESFKKKINEDKIHIEKLYIKLNEQKAFLIL